MAQLPNPEHDWEPPAAARFLDRGEVEQRIGPTDEPLAILGGGLANLNVRIGADRVLRIHLRDPASAAIERALLSRRWSSFRVPEVLAAGADYLLLRHVPHRPLSDGHDHGAAVGRALAEIHATVFAAAGFLDASLEVAAPLGVLPAALVAHMRGLPLDPAWHAIRDQAADTLERDGDELRAALGAPRLLHGDWKPSNLHLTHTGELLVLDWEFAFAGPALLDVGQLVRWSPPAPFVAAFAAGYQSGGGELPAGWQGLAARLDLVNLVGLLGDAQPGSRRGRDVVDRLRASLAP